MMQVNAKLVSFGGAVSFRNIPKDKDSDPEGFKALFFMAYRNLKESGFSDALISIQKGPPENFAAHETIITGEQGLLVAALAIAANRAFHSYKKISAHELAQTVGKKVAQILNKPEQGPIYPYLGPQYPRHIPNGLLFTPAGQMKDIMDFCPIT